MNPDIEKTADRIYTRYGTFDRAIDAATDHKHGHLPESNGYLFWDAVIQKLKLARKSLGI